MILFDGWPLVHQPGSPAALHLHELLALLPVGLEVCLAVPSPLAERPPVPLALIKTGNTAWGRLAWEQVILPRLARRIGADALHTTVVAAPVFFSGSVLFSPGEALGVRPAIRLVGERMRAAFAHGGFSMRAGPRANRLLLWPDDLPAPNPPGPQLRCMPPLAFPALYQLPEYQPPGEAGYVAAFAPFTDALGLEKLVESWRWATPALGEDWSLQLANYPASQAHLLQSASAAAQLPGALLPAPLRGPADLAGLLQAAGAVLHLGPLAPLLQTLASGRPLAAEGAWGIDARVGPAAYLTPTGEGRALGAAILTLLVDANVAAQISQSARERAAAWRSRFFAGQLEEIYRSLPGDR